MKIQLFKKENSLKKKNFQFNPNLYWRIALFGAFIMTVLSCFFGYRLFLQINQEPVLPPSDKGGQIPTVDKTRIEDALNYFSVREKESTQILSSPASVVDPSL